MPSRSHGVLEHTDAFATSDNLTQWDPWSGNPSNLQPWYSGDSPIPYDARRAGGPFPTRPAVGTAYVTPSRFWNVNGPSGLDQGEWPIVAATKMGSRYYQFGFPKPMQLPWLAAPGNVNRNLPSNPPPQPFLGNPI